MRFHYHDVRDMPHAIVLACNLRRMVQACLALLWTLAVVLSLILVLGWRATGEILPDGPGIQSAVETLCQWPDGPGRLAFWACVLTGWWLGFGYLNAPLVRSAALEIARDERGKLPAEPALYRMAAGAPVLAMILPAALALVVLVWSLITLIPDIAGALLTVFTFPLALACALVASLAILLIVASAPMMPATAVVEGRDYLEALSRPAGYVLQKPFRYAGYLLAKLAVVLVALVLGGLVLAGAWAVIAGCIYVTAGPETYARSLQVAMAPWESPPLEQLTPFALASLFWATVGLLVCWLSVVSQGCDLIIYLLMRYRIEGTTYDQVLVAEDRLKLYPTAQDTEAEAEAARKRFDALQGAQPPAEQASEKPAAEVAGAPDKTA